MNILSSLALLRSAAPRVFFPLSSFLFFSILITQYYLPSTALGIGAKCRALRKARAAGNAQKQKKGLTFRLIPSQLW